MERLATLLGRFEEEKNEELFGILTSQVVRLYALKPRELGAKMLFTLAQNFTCASTSKRLVAAALLEKMIAAIAAAEDALPHFFEQGALDPAAFAREAEEEPRPGAKARPRALNVEEFLQLDIAAATFDDLKRVVGKRENMLYSKSETKIERKEKESGRVREEDDLRRIDEQVLRDEGFDFDQPKKERGGAKRAKHATQSGAEALVQLQPPGARPTSIPETLLALAHYLVFNSRWEVRHGGLLIFRAVARQAQALLPVSRLGLGAGSFRPEPAALAGLRAQIAEEIKQRSMLVLSLDCFSDFLSDKTNMVNRGLAAEILLLVFRLRPNIADFSNFFDFLLYQRGEHWQSKQALFYLFKQLVENADRERIALVQSFNDQLICKEYVEPSGCPADPFALSEAFRLTAVLSAARVFKAHEEVTQMALEFLASCARRRLPELVPARAEQFAALTLEALHETVEISFLPLAAFELLRQLLLTDCLPTSAVTAVPALARKFLFHDNDAVRAQIFAFLTALFERLPDLGAAAVDLGFCFRSLVFAYCVRLGDKARTAATLRAICLAAAPAERRALLVSLLELPAFNTLQEAIQAIDADFSFSADRNALISPFAVIELSCEVLAGLPEPPFAAAELQPLLARNSLAAVPFLLAGGAPPLDAAALLELTPADFHLAGLAARLERLLQTVKTFFNKFKPDLLALGDAQLKASISELLLMFREARRERLRDFFNLFVAFSGQLKQALERGAAPTSANQMRVYLEGEVLGELKEVCTAYYAFADFCRAAAAASLVGEAAAARRVPAQKLNALVKPLLDALETPLAPFFAAKFCAGLFGLIPAFAGEPRSPNQKVLETLLRRAEGSAQLRQNAAEYVAAVLRLAGQSVFEQFPQVEAVFRSDALFEAFGPLIGCVGLEDAHAPAPVELRAVERLRGYAFAQAPHKAVSALFEQGLQRSRRGNGAVLSAFLSDLLAAFTARAPAAVATVAHLLVAHGAAFVAFSRIFVAETIRLVAEPGPERAAYFDLFVRVLTLAGLEGGESVTGLDPALRALAVGGEEFIADFRNSRHFAVDERLLAELLGPTALRPYQLEGVRWLNFLFKYGLSGALCDDMGLGKTLQTLVAVAMLHQSAEERVSLVVVPPSLVYHWEKECTRYITASRLRPRVISPADPPHAAAAAAELWIVSYGNLARLPQLQQQRFAAVVVDEAHIIKNPKTAAFQHVKQLRGRVRLALTGTPVQNNVLELWSVFDFLLPEYLGPQERFRRDYRLLLELNLLACDVEKMELSAAQQKVLNDLHARVLPFIMRREKGEVLQDLPPKIIQDIDCELAPLQQKLYDALVAGESALASQLLRGPPGQARSPSFLALLSRLRRVLNHPALLAESLGAAELQALAGGAELPALEGDFAASGKFLALFDLLLDLGFSAEAAAANALCPHKLLLFTRCLRTLAMLEAFVARKFPGLELLTLTQALSPAERGAVVERFNASPELKLLLLTPRVGGLGLNLSSADVVVMFDHDFNPMNDLQAMDRAHRIGQRRVVHVYRLVSRGTLEEKILGIQRFKVSVSRTVVNVENASIDNVRNADFIGNLERFASENAGEKAEEEQPLLRVLREMDLQKLWSEDEYEKEYL